MGASLSGGNEFRKAFEEAQKEALDRNKKQGNTVASVKRLSHNTVSIKFESSDRLKLVPGGHVSIRSASGFSRSYTPYLIEEDGFTVMVKAYPGGKVSSYLCSVKPGDFVVTSAPIEPRFNINLEVPTGGDKSTLLMIAGGTGIAPLYSMAEAVLQRPGNVTRVVLFACFRNEDDSLLTEELAALSRAFPFMFQLVYVFSQKVVSTFRGSPACSGRFSAQHLMSANVVEANSAVVCGPPSFGGSVSDIVEQNIKIRPENVVIM